MSHLKATCPLLVVSGACCRRLHPTLAQVVDARPSFIINISRGEARGPCQCLEESSEGVLDLDLFERSTQMHLEVRSFQMTLAAMADVRGPEGAKGALSLSLSSCRGLVLVFV